MNPTYIDSTIQRISSKYGCSQINNQSNFQSFTRCPDYIVIPLKNNYNNYNTSEDKVPNLPLVNNNRKEPYEWPQVSTVIVAPKSTKKHKSKNKSKS